MAWKVQIGMPGGSMDPITLAVIIPPAAIGYSIVYMLFGGGIVGAILIFIVAKMFGR